MAGLTLAADTDRSTVSSASRWTICAAASRPRRRTSGAASPTSEAELFWALRGGGGNFGVATSLYIRLHPVPEVLSGFIVYPWTQAAQVWRQLDEILHDRPDELTVQSGILPGPDGSPTVLLSTVWSGELSRGRSVLERLQRLGTPLTSDVAPRRYADMLGSFDAHTVIGRHYALRTRSVSRFTPEVIAVLIEAGQSQSSPLSAVFVHHFHVRRRARQSKQRRSESAARTS